MPRERQRAVKERSALTNGIRGLFKLHGISDLKPRASDFDVVCVAMAYSEPIAAESVRPLSTHSPEDRASRRTAGAGPAAARGRTRRGKPSCEDRRTVPRGGGCGQQGLGRRVHRGADLAPGGRRQRRDPAGVRGALPPVRQPPRTRERGRQTPTTWASDDIQRHQGIARHGPAWIHAQLLRLYINFDELTTTCSG